MKKLPPLYKVDSKNKIREYFIEYDDHHYITFSGLQNGTLTQNINTPTPKGKNTLAEQVEKEARAKWRKKYERKLYSEDLTKPHPLAFIQPMPALDYTKVPHRVDWENCWITQPKLNGVRCIVQLINGVVKLTSREGTVYSVPHIEQMFTYVYTYAPQDRIFDGELYLHNRELGDVTHAVAHGDPDLLFKLFDHVDESKSFTERYADICSHTLVLGTHIEIVPINTVYNETDLKAIHNQYVKAGYEGAMLRDTETIYTPGKRTPGMFKYKHFKDSEFEIVGVELDKDGGAILQLKTLTGILFTSRPKGSNAYRQRLVNDKHLLTGKMATVKYSELLKSGIPEFNRVIAIRDYE